MCPVSNWQLGFLEMQTPGPFLRPTESEFLEMGSGIKTLSRWFIYLLTKVWEVLSQKHCSLRYSKYWMGDGGRLSADKKDYFTASPKKREMKFSWRNWTPLLVPYVSFRIQIHTTSAVFKMFWSQDYLKLSKIIEDPKEFLFMWVISTAICCVWNFKKKT